MNLRPPLSFFLCVSERKNERKNALDFVWKENPAGFGRKNERENRWRFWEILWCRVEFILTALFLSNSRHIIRKFSDYVEICEEFSLGIKCVLCAAFDRNVLQAQYAFVWMWCWLSVNMYDFAIPSERTTHLYRFQRTSTNFVYLINSERMWYLEMLVVVSFSWESVISWGLRHTTQDVPSDIFPRSLHNFGKYATTITIMIEFSYFRNCEFWNVRRVPRNFLLTIFLLSFNILITIMV